MRQLFFSLKLREMVYSEELFCTTATGPYVNLSLQCSQIKEVLLYYRYRAICRPMTAISSAVQGERLFISVMCLVSSVALGLSIGKEVPYMGWENDPSG